MNQVVHSHDSNRNNSEHIYSLLSLVNGHIFAQNIVQEPCHPYHSKQNQLNF